ncbi:MULTISPECIES: four-helix bundle copper-binding protein [Streptomyces]|uniref:Ferredoxin n=1 Tax=Streptomyces antibioticus TaxID=1890 RepID=A0AAE6Y9X2_STRAT|nr:MULTISPECIES: four-helix bundle copper-binding protein [Streptomyces]MBO7937153.1 four-helix bundle copper-binding protein [Streptomyces sp. S9]MCX4738764.1 four-helix bundle copper-binding protein [Streptomyces antibioticus]MCX5169443.1 four-helix bundle copper-binding protein [Streptomyces antibioticus]NUV63298.1 four-helix bundle copper-binding protein [Streptomyces sp. CAI-85]OOQ50732.1 ferredoxin [Streptomyces antibioticus]
MTQSGSMTTMTQEMQDAVQACMACHGVCEETMSACMNMGGQAQMQIMRALMDCSETTRMCADMMMRRSPLAAEMCAMCATACDMCAEACMSMPDDPQMMRCADSCRRCAEMCRAMAGATM